tara:strand:+ start:886 stop:1002 length:117 start_codon:yes stop_codon:yes gene_type:complete
MAGLPEMARLAGGGLAASGPLKILQKNTSKQINATVDA